MEVYYHQSGEAQQIQLSEKEEQELFQLVKEIFAGVDDILRLYVDSSRVAALKQTDKLIEFIFKDEILFDTNGKGRYKLKKILLPLSGELLLNPEMNSFVVVTGDENYSGSPLLVNGRQEQLKKVLEMIELKRDKSK